MEFAARYGSMAVIAGGSEGVGAAYARLLTQRGLDVALLARQPQPLAILADELRAAFPARDIRTLSLDLSAPDAPERVLALTGDRTVGMLVYNAGASDRTGDFVDGDLDAARRLLAINATTKMALCHAYGARMKRMGRGGIITISSLAALVGNPGLAIYSGVKAFSSIFTEALWHELRPFGVDVLSQVLAMTNTPSIARHFPKMAGLGDDPAAIAASGLEALGNGPVLRSGPGDALARMLAELDRATAVERTYEMGAPFRA